MNRNATELSPNTAPRPTRLQFPSVKEILLWGIITLSPLQDTVLQKTPLKLFGASPAVLPVLALASLALFRQILRLKFALDRKMLIGIGYVLAICVAHIITFQPGLDSIQWRPLRSFGLMTALIVFLMTGVDYKNTRGLRFAIFMAASITLAGVALGALLGPDSMRILQVTPDAGGRPRGFCTESSTLSVQIVCVGMLCSHYLLRTWKKVVTGVITGGLLIYSSSKGGLISLLLCVLILALMRSRASVFSKILAGIVVSPILVFGVLLVASRFSSLVMLNQTTTIATRVSMALFSGVVVLHNPLGVGFTGFYPAIPRYLYSAMWTVQSWFPFPLAFTEVREYLTPPFKDADCKSFFLDFLVFFGIPFAIVFFRFGNNLLQELLAHRLFSLFVAVLFAFLALFTYYSTMNAYTVPLLMGIAIYETRRHEAAVRLH